MTSGSCRIFWLLVASLCLASVEYTTKTQENLQQPDVEIEGLRQEYPSCALVQFSVRNIAQQEIYLEVYAEQFKANAWTDEDWAYDLRDPRSLYIKRLIVNPDMIRIGASVDVTYDRCLRPNFVKETKSAFINAIEKKDKEAGRPVLQRLRANVYFLDQGHVKRVQQVWSKAFERIPEERLDQSPKHGNSSIPD